MNLKIFYKKSPCYLKSSSWTNLSKIRRFASWNNCLPWKWEKNRNSEVMALDLNYQADLKWNKNTFCNLLKMESLFVGFYCWPYIYLLIFGLIWWYGPHSNMMWFIFIIFLLFAIEKQCLKLSLIFWFSIQCICIISTFLIFSTEKVQIWLGLRNIRAAQLYPFYCFLNTTFETIMVLWCSWKRVRVFTYLELLTICTFILRREEFQAG